MSTLRELAIELNTSVASVRASGVPFDPVHGSKGSWEDAKEAYLKAMEIVTNTCESIDNVCHRLELNPKVLTRKIYGTERESRILGLLEVANGHTVRTKDFGLTVGALRTHVCNLRTRGYDIETIVGVGYRISTDVPETEPNLLNEVFR